MHNKIVAGAKTKFLQGDQWVYLSGIVALLLGAASLLHVPEDEAGRGAGGQIPHRGLPTQCIGRAEPAGAVPKSA
jgi:hypothetical protein